MDGIKDLVVSGLRIRMTHNAMADVLDIRATLDGDLLFLGVIPRGAWPQIKAAMAAVEEELTRAGRL